MQAAQQKYSTARLKKSLSRNPIHSVLQTCTKYYYLQLDLFSIDYINKLPFSNSLKQCSE